MSLDGEVRGWLLSVVVVWVERGRLLKPQFTEGVQFLHAFLKYLLLTATQKQ